MAIKPSVMFGHVMHRRLFPKVNAFTYKIFYMALPLSQLQNTALAYNRFGLLSFHNQDHGDRTGAPIENWARDILKKYSINKADGEIVLVTLPRVLGYVFNPVSFWLCFDREEKLRAVICEVNNTFGQTHSYLCAHSDQKEISSDDVFEGDKLFHVSPFLERTGHYFFRFDWRDESGGFWVNYHDVSGKKQLLTALSGRLSPLNKKNIHRAFWGYPLVTLKAIFLIHWQAIKLVLKGIKYIPLPRQKETKISTTRNIKDL